ncbi:MAG: response regulator [Candidatus Schekmanbacteria bacterium]|nr:response regulator [Candidatus Schekmanbacteria bacterium]
MQHLPSLVVSIGASAGGITACRMLLEHAPADAGIAYVIVQHLAPAHESHVASILQSATNLEITQVEGNERLEPNHVYVIAPATSLRVRDGSLEVGTPDQPHFRARPIDAFLSSVAASYAERAVGIILSGTGDDGSAGLREIRAAGGLCLVQEPETAEFDAMPRRAIDTGVADAVVPPEEMGLILLEYATVPRSRPASYEAGRQVLGEPGDGLDAVLALLGRQYGINFRNYKMGTLQRRTERRMGIHRISGWHDYLELLRTQPQEIEALYRDVLIGVTSFFRDPGAWRHLQEQVVPELLESHEQDTSVRVWSAGCATGEEAYSLAMVFLEQIARKGSHLRLQVFASDLSHEALAFARQGLFPADIQGSFSEERLRRFFRRVGDTFQMDQAVRDVVTFAAHNLLSDPPFSSLDLVSCRNVLIYLQPHAQEKLLEMFHYSLRAKGTLWLGSTETIGGRPELFDVSSSKHRMYRPLGPVRMDRNRVQPWQTARAPAYGVPFGPAGPLKRQKATRILEQFVLQRHTSACVAIDRSFDILYFFGPTGEYLVQPPGQVRMDLFSWARPGLYAQLRGGLIEAIEQKRMVTITGMSMERESGTVDVEVTIEPLTSVAEAEGLFIVAFRDLPRPPEAAASLVEGGVADVPLTRQLEVELKNTRLELRRLMEQLQTVNEEHQASHEELLSLNEEIQSSNEELETSKEEMQSLNEELMTTNRQLEDRNAELHSLASDLKNLLVSAAVPTFFLDRELRIRRYTPACSEIMRVVPSDVGRSLDHVKLQVQDEHLLADIGRVLEKLVPVEAEVTADGGRWFFRRVLPYRTENERIDGVCVTYHEVSAQKRAAIESEEARLYAESIIHASRMPLLVLDTTLKVVSASKAYHETFQTSAEETEGRLVFELGNGQWDIPRLRRLLEEILPRERDLRGYDVEHAFESIGWRAMRINGHMMKRVGQADLILVAIEDITDLRLAEMAAEKRSDELERDHRRKDEFLAMLGHELRNPLSAVANGIAIISGTDGIPPRVEQVSAMMERQIQRMTTLLDQILDVGRVISGKLEIVRESVDLVEAVRSGIETVTPMIDIARHELTTSLPPEGTVLVLGDAGRLAQVVENLLANAVKYTDNGGRIWLTVKATEDTVKLSIRDNGIGMEPEVLAHAFELFTQAPRFPDRAKGGLGLGLALVRSLVEMHRGHVVAFSAGLGSGSEFVVTLPRLRTGRLALLRGRQAGQQPVVPHEVLIVDDEEDAATTLVDLLTMRGHDVRAAHDGPSALEAARGFHPDVVLLDLGLPGMDGYAVARKLREEHGTQMRIIAMTGYQKDADQLQEAGFDEHLLKPPDIDRLTSLIAGVDARDAGPGG